MFCYKKESILLRDVICRLGFHGIKEMKLDLRVSSSSVRSFYNPFS